MCVCVWGGGGHIFLWGAGWIWNPDLIFDP